MLALFKPVISRTSFKSAPRALQLRNHLVTSTSVGKRFNMTSLSSRPAPQRPVGKKYVIACDGTWQNSDMSGDQVPSNVVRIVRAIKHFDSAGTSQITYYQRGVGTDGNLEDKVLGGFTGSDVSEHIREAYAMLANNFNPETQQDLQSGTGAVDQIIILGFSRGAFTARAIASLISDVGLLTKLGMEYFWGIFADWKNQGIAAHKSEWFQNKFPKIGNVAFTDPSYRQALMDNGFTRWGMKIRAVGVWDTVGALGVPFHWGSKNVKEFSFVNTKVARHTQHAFQALALDEHRNLFTPTLWEQPDSAHNLKKLKQCWFPGVHSNIGGSYDDAGMSNITLAWMVSQLEDHDGGILTFDHSYLFQVEDWNTQGYAKRHEPARAWGMGRLYDSASHNNVITAAQGVDPIIRTPGKYCQVDLKTGLQNPNAPLQNTNEYIHRSVRVRINAGGLGTEEDPATTTAKIVDVGLKVKDFFQHKKEVPVQDPSPYDSAALKDYKLVQPQSVKIENDHSSPGPSGVYWHSTGRDLPEDDFGQVEIEMMRHIQNVGKAH